MKKTIALRIEGEVWRKIKAQAAIAGLHIGEYLKLLAEDKAKENAAKDC